ncbi:phospholipase A2 inhibitor gamma subunit B-like [Engystomops pustulosus]|uniref:phospholipase A2 inhibitor gamma subunit B-like n=1 Tax=Engystomops pustulosus TaxID=76066 RepID=UPI003AFADE47
MAMRRANNDLNKEEDFSDLQLECIYCGSSSLTCDYAEFRMCPTEHQCGTYILYTGYCLQCVTCSFGTNECASPTVVSCPTGKVCAARQTITVAAGIIFQSFEKFCSQPSECNATGTFSTMIGSSNRIATTCCSEDRCTPAKPIAPDVSTETNGGTCPTCWGLSCEHIESLECVGDQTICLQQITRKTIGSLTETTVKRGCASEGFCYKGNESAINGAVHEEVTYSCTPSSGTTFTTTMSTKTYTISFLFLIVVLIQ